MIWRRVAGGMLALILLAGLLWGGLAYRRVRADYDAYRARIQPGITIEGVNVGWLTPDEARARVEQQIVAPYRRDFTLHFQEQVLTLSPITTLGLNLSLDEAVSQAVAASHQGSYWRGFWGWVRGQVETLDLDIPLQVTFDQSAAARFLAQAAKAYNVPPVEPMVDIRTLTFIPGQPGMRLDVERAAAAINAGISDPGQRELTLPVEVIRPDQSAARIESMLSTLGPIMEQPPTPPSFFTATLPLSSTGGLAGTRLVTYTGELTWTFPYFADYRGPLTSTYGFFFDPGKAGARFDVQRATRQIEAALQAGATGPITFEPDPVPPPPLTPALLIPPLEARLAEFDGLSSLLVKDLDSGQVLYDANTDDILSGMSVVKIGIMVEVYRHFEGNVDPQTHQELMNMLGRESCNPCANRLLAAVGNGSGTAGAQKVTSTMRRLGLEHFYLCSPFRIVERSLPGQERLHGTSQGQLILTAYHAPSLLADVWWALAATPRYDRCVHATPREMADLVEMIYRCTQGDGRLRQTDPEVFTPSICQEMIDIMAANDLRNMLGAGIPAEVKLAHKHGFAGYGVSWGDTRAEVGIVFSPGATYLVSFYIWQDTPWIDFGVAQPLYRDVSNLLYNYFNPNAPYWPLPPWAPSNSR